ncbi:hypothetical protein [Chryseobacterium sp. MFBS3-17]|uniref:hypothetical protein n=1 Tax=Chryseobacterium sp. MFBS3-17 TaxID=2886689 RepID=UPI001D0E8A02|nr:hypothetical protein [Chryseobacterium sp. MFBS3-17]MCC2589769.1 hypothetical protein [Chryseobacterium sp. MFBS3-17]
MQYLRDNPKSSSGATFSIEPIPLSEIQYLETKYNNGVIFPKALRELLFLAGEYCYVLDYNIYDSQEELQDEAREWLQKYNRSISRPFFAIDVYNAGEQFLFVYLDEGDDPVVRSAYLPLRDDVQFITNLMNEKLSHYIKSSIDEIKQGFNPF